MISIEASVSKGWLHQAGGFVFDNRYYFDPIYRWEQDAVIHAFVSERFPDYPIYNMEANLMQAKYMKKNHVLVGAIQPNMILAAILGAEFSIFEDKDSDVLGKPLESLTRKEDLPPLSEILYHPLVHDLERQMVQVAEKRPDLRVIPPFFWDESGRATIHGIITTSLKLTGDTIMITMLSDPALAHDVHCWIADAYITLIHHFAALAHLPITSVHVGECAGPLLSAELYDEFIVPYITRIGKELGSIRLHSCGNSDHITQPMTHIVNLQIIDTGSDSSLRLIRHLKGRNFTIHVAPPMELMMKDVPQSRILEWLDKTLEDNDNGPLQIAYHLESHYEVNNCLVLHDELERRGIVKKERFF